MVPLMFVLSATINVKNAQPQKQPARHAILESIGHIKQVLIHAHAMTPITMMVLIPYA
jgi:hypothetical protein